MKAGIKTLAESSTHILDGHDQNHSTEIGPRCNPRSEVWEIALELQQVTKRGLKRLSISIAVLGVLPLLVVLDMVADFYGYARLKAALPFFLLVPVLVNILNLVLTYKTPRRQKDMFDTLMREADSSVVGPLLDLYAGLPFIYGQLAKQYYDALRGTLIRVLPTLQESDSPALSAGNRAFLHRKIEQDRFGPLPKERADFIIAVLKAIEQIGDKRSLKLVCQLARMPDSVKGERRRILEAACECLPLLESRLERINGPIVLLRPSASAAAENETLLQSVLTSASDPETLLRPGEEH